MLLKPIDETQTALLPIKNFRDHMAQFQLKYYLLNGGLEKASTAT